MNVHLWWLFVAAMFLLCAIPGPNMLHIMSRSVDLGWRRSIAAMAGCLSALVLVLAASAAGLASVLLALPGAFDVLRYVGIAYLFYLAFAAWRAEASPLDPASGALPPAISTAKLFRGGFAVGASNPKLILFAAAFLPQFVDPRAPQPPQFAILVATSAVLETFWYFIYALGGASLALLLRRPVIRRGFNRMTGVVFAGFGLALLRLKPS